MFAAIVMAVFGIDDLAVDCIYFCRRGWRRLTVYSRHRRASAATLPPPARPGRIAIIIPAWDEAAVIGDMLRALLNRLRHDDYAVFVGVYPNDPATMAAVRAVDDSRIIMAVTARDGPTTKADCLNRLWRAVLVEELRAARPFKAIVMHDAEDVVHSMELYVVDRLIERCDMIQFPVLPIPDPRSRWISGHYLDEFAESHGKELVVREALGAAMPSAGVGCAISRAMLDKVALANGGNPFNPASLTEDYELGIRIGMLGGKGILARVPGDDGRMTIATHEHFHATLEEAVRQKTRWLTGIVIHGWDRLGWHDSLAESWMRLRDRKSLLAAAATLAAYMGAIGGMLVNISAAARPDIRHVDVLPLDGLWPWLFWFNGLTLSWRLAMRFVFTSRSYGLAEGLRAVPRAFVANMIMVLASLRVLRNALRMIGSHAPIEWQKTRHRFPTVLPGE